MARTPSPAPGSSGAVTQAAPQDGGLKRGLNMRHIQFIALGSAIGTGLFYGSSAAIQAAGPLVLVAYVLAGAAVFMVMRALGEMAVRHPIPGSFGQYAARYLGPFAGFVTGWTFIFEMIVVAIADVTAFGVYMAFWFPDTPRWIWVVAVILFIAAINTRNVKVFGEMEFWLSIIKVGAIIAMIVGGLALMIFGMTMQGGDPTGPQNLVNHGGFAPKGIEGLMAALAVVVFAFGGIETVGITAGEAANPKRAIPRAVNTVPARVLIFYVGTLAIIMSLIPWNQITGEASPFVQIFTSLGLDSAATVLNIIVITAAISAINADTFAAGRMMFGLAKQGHAPNVCGRVSKNGVPFMAVIIMCIALSIGAVLNWLIPEDVFAIIASIATFATVWVWMMILISHIAMRREIAAKGLPESEFKVPLWPLGSWLALGFICLVVVLLAVFPKTQVSLVVGAVWLAVLALAYLALVRGGGRSRPELHDDTAAMRVITPQEVEDGAVRE